MAIKLYTSPGSGVKVYASDWKVFAKELRLADKQASFQLKRDFKNIMRHGQVSVRNELKSLGTKGPMRGMRHGGRTGWGRNYGSTAGPVSTAKRYPYNSVLVEAFNRPKRDQTGIGRLRVRSGATVQTDLAQKLSGRSRTRNYQIRLFGGPEITRTHAITYKGVAYFIRNLGPVSKPSKKRKSRNVYPGFDKAESSMTREALKAIDKAVKIVEANIDRNNR